MKKLMIIFAGHFKSMCSNGMLFRSSVSGSTIWKTYIETFKEDPIFRDPNSSSKNCNNCANFLRRYGNIVCIKDNKIVSLFDIEVDEEYKESFEALSQLVKNSVISNVFVETFQSLNSLPYEVCKKSNEVYRLGIELNHKQYSEAEAKLYGVVQPGEIRTFNHFFLNLPKEYVDLSGSSIEAIQAVHRTAKEVFLRGMEEIPLDTLELVTDLIIQGSLLNADHELPKLKVIMEYKEEYDTIPKEDKDNWCWTKSYKLGLAKFKNSLIGVTLSDLAEGKDINLVCLEWNKRADKANYMKAVAPITEAQKKKARKIIEDLGYMESLNRRFANLDDIKASEIKHMNVSQKGIKEISVFDKIQTKSTRHKKSSFEGVEEVHIDKFMEEILPRCSSVEAYLRNDLEFNMATLTTAVDEDSKVMFKWNNHYSWTNKGNLAGKSELTSRVESAGGRIDGVFRFTHSWNKLEPNGSLMDLHVFMPGHKHVDTKFHNSYGTGRRVGWNHREDYYSKGSQDVDYISVAPQGYVPVENITFPNLDKMPVGDYVCKIHNWSFRRTGGKGEAEIAIGNKVYQYVYPATKHHEWITVATVSLDKFGNFSIKHHLPETNESKEIYGLESENFHKVNLVCYSPNYWGDNNVGHKHIFFMLEGCKTDEATKSFHAENLNSELYEARKTLDKLGDVTKIVPKGEKQLSGIGFNTTVRDELIVKLKGNFNRVLKLKF